MNDHLTLRLMDLRYNATDLEDVVKEVEEHVADGDLDGAKLVLDSAQGQGRTVPAVLERAAAGAGGLIGGTTGADANGARLPTACPGSVASHPKRYSASPAASSA